MARVLLTAVQIEEKLSLLTSYDEAIFHSVKKTELEQMGRGLLPNFSKLTREQLIDGLLQLTSERRKLRNLKIEEEITEKISANTVALQAKVDEQDVRQLSVAYNRDGYEDKSTSTPEALGLTWFLELKNGLAKETKENVVASLSAKILYLESSNYPNICTRVTRRTTYIDQMNRAARLDGSKPIVYDTIQSIREILLTAWREESQAHRDVYLKTLTNPDGKREVLDEDLVVQLVEDATYTLNNLTTSTWIEIAIALGLATGRRPTEIMCSASFIFHSEYEVKFSGQLKEKGSLSVKQARLQQEYILPTILKAELVVAGLKYLNEMKYPTKLRLGESVRIPLDMTDPNISTKLCAKKCSKPLSRGMFKYPGVMFKDLRKFYCIACYYVFKDEQTRVIPYYSMLLGHDNNSMNGLNAAQAYDKYYLLPETVVQIKQLIA